MFRFRWAVVSLLIFVIGCGKPDRVPVVPTEGIVTQGGKPATGALLHFHTVGSSAPAAGTISPPIPWGQVGADGSFRLTTYANGDGAPSGDYAITVVWPTGPQRRDGDDDGPTETDLLRGRYAQAATTPLRATVGPTRTTLPTIELK